MRLKKQEREFFRKVLENFIVKNPHFRQCQVVDHFVREGIARRTVYYTLNRRKNGQSILEVTRRRSPFILDTFYEGKIEETGKPPKRSVRLQISQESKNYRSPNKKIRYRGLCS